MIGRPCKPDADFARLWRTLMPGTPFPACGVANNYGDAGECPEPATALRRDHVPTAAPGE
jgi:hypothetical protein